MDRMHSKVFKRFNHFQFEIPSLSFSIQVCRMRNIYVALHCNYMQVMAVHMKLARRNCVHTRRAVVNERREHVISNFDTNIRRFGCRHR